MQISDFLSTTSIRQLLNLFFPSPSKKEGKDFKNLFFNESQKPSTNTVSELKIPSLKGKDDVYLNISILKLPQIDLKPIDTSVLLQPLEQKRRQNAVSMNCKEG